MRVQSVVVAYNPGPRLSALCDEMAQASVSVLVIDNASSTGRDVLRSCAAAGARLLRMQENVGVGGALQAALETVTDDTEWLLTFDQDSVLPVRYVETLTCSAAVADPSVAMIGPVVLDEASGSVQQGGAGVHTPYLVRRLITSGSLSRVAALREVGGYNAGFFIDYVDFELCLRLRAAGWRLAVEPAVVMRHSIGQLKLHRLSSRWSVPNSHHAPDRQYYKYRNYLLLAKSGFLAYDRRWAIRSALSLLLAPSKIALFEEDRLAKLTAVVCGLRDGLRGRTGPRGGPFGARSRRR